MALVNQVRKNVKMDLWSIVKFQLAVHCHLKQMNVSDQDLSCLTFLALSGEKELTDFCETATKNKIFGSSQSVRNAVTKAEKKGLIVKNGKSKKTILLNPDMKIQISGNILLDYKFIHVEPKES
ncbi:hypothetical protein EB118_07115 [bacterium]|nr:hypothetical protein [bacterium]NDD82932.1 hypothetical protein [bacterium]NDG29851.1 hypothetical protein [bacterium]